MHKILLCEKNEFFRSTLHRIIQSSLPQINLKVVVSQAECRDAVESFTPDILILGSSLYSGLELNLIEQLRESHPEVTIILFTDYNIDEYRKEAVLRGVNHTASKDLWTGSEILTLIKTILRTRENQAQPEARESAAEGLFLKRPLERRRRDARGRNLEREYLTRNPDRRKNSNAEYSEERLSGLKAGNNSGTLP